MDQHVTLQNLCNCIHGGTSEAGHTEYGCYKDVEELQLSACFSQQPMHGFWLMHIYTDLHILSQSKDLYAQTRSQVTCLLMNQSNMSVPLVTALQQHNTLCQLCQLQPYHMMMTSHQGNPPPAPDPCANIAPGSTNGAGCGTGAWNIASCSKTGPACEVSSATNF